MGQFKGVPCKVWSALMVIKVNKKGYPKEYDTLFVDTETTGLYPDEDDCIIQIAGFFMDKKGRVSDKFNFRM